MAIHEHPEAAGRRECWREAGVGCATERRGETGKLPLWCCLAGRRSMSSCTSLGKMVFSTLLSFLSLPSLIYRPFPWKQVICWKEPMVWAHSSWLVHKHHHFYPHRILSFLFSENYSSSPLWRLFLVSIKSKIMWWATCCDRVPKLF